MNTVGTPKPTRAFGKQQVGGRVQLGNGGAVTVGVYSSKQFVVCLCACCQGSAFVENIGISCCIAN